MKLGAITPSKSGMISFFKFIKKYWYVIFVILAILPNVIDSIQTAKETQNPLHPFLQVGISMANADSIIYEDVKTLQENPEELIGMQKPDKGIFKKIKYWWSLLMIVWKFLGNIFLITVPFKIIYWMIKGRNISEPYKNAGKTIWMGLLFIFFINLLLVIAKAVEGTLEMDFPTGYSIYQKVAVIIYLHLPFHGLFALLKYMVTIII